MSSLAVTIKWHAVRRVAACLGHFTLEYGTYLVLHSSHCPGHWHDAHLQQSFPLVTCPDTSWATKIILRFLKKLKIELPYDPAITLLGIYPEKTIIQKDTCTPTFTAALFTIARSWKQPIDMPIDRQMDKEDVVHMHNGILLSHKKE